MWKVLGKKRSQPQNQKISRKLQNTKTNTPDSSESRVPHQDSLSFLFVVLYTFNFVQFFFGFLQVFLLMLLLYLAHFSRVLLGFCLEGEGICCWAPGSPSVGENPEARSERSKLRLWQLQEPNLGCHPPQGIAGLKGPLTIRFPY